MEKTKKGDFVELKYTGTTDGNIFDSNIEEDLKNTDNEVKARKVIVMIGEKMIVEGLDRALADKEIGKDHDVDVVAKEGFGARKREMIKTIPLTSFKEHKINPVPGMVLTLDNQLVKIVSVSGGRVLTDFNNPLSGKDLHYKFQVTRKVTDDKEKAEALFELMFKFVPESEIKDGKVIIKGPQVIESFIKVMGAKFKEMHGMELGFELKEEKAVEGKKEETVTGNVVEDSDKN
jgi:peptidylprolyl isomerase